MPEQNPSSERDDLYPSQLREQDLEQRDIKSLRKEVETKAMDAISWYIKNKRTKANGSRILRISAILLILLGAVSPILQATDWLPFKDCQYGYIAFAIAATCIALDKFLGFSTSWMRYMTTAIKLQKALAEFQADWVLLWAEVSDNTPTVEQQRKILQRIKEFRLKIFTEIEQETQIWTNEFQSNLTQLDSVANSKQESRQPGILDLKVTNGHLAELGLTVLIDGITVAHTRQERVQIGHIFPGQHEVMVHGIADGKELRTSSVINMTAGATVDLKLSLN